jgi:hypothetical protein
LNQQAIWKELAEKLPWRKTEKERQLRIKQWRYVDMNNNGFLSLAEVDKGMRDAIKLPILFNLKPVLMRAFQAAKNKVKSKSKHGKDFIEKAEWRFFLKYLRQYYEYWVAFDRINQDDDRRLSYEEFVNAAPIIGKWGIDMRNPEAQWRKCDSNGAGMVLFDEFCNWAIKNGLDLDDDDDNDRDEGDVQNT